ncbi:hypothetical protein AB0F77_40365 [Streptomyces sp. NPDC026672]|uniref:hypothetical protein n=1 Tax=unclassified Streptomyces TaxID=2593676 RepID=UPI0033DF9483
MTEDSIRCLRPDCQFAPLPALTDSGALEVSEFCSEACRAWLAQAIHVARCDDSPETERAAHRLHLIAELLGLRDHADDMTFFTTPTPVLVDPTAVNDAG